MIFAMLTLAACPMGGSGCDGIYGPEGVAVAFTVADEGDYAWSIVGEQEEMNCTVTVPGDGFIDCDAGTFAFTGPDAAEGGGWTFGTTLWTDGDANVHVTLTSGAETLLDTDIAPDWQPVTDEGNCADHLRAAQTFDLRDGSDTGG